MRMITNGYCWFFLLTVERKDYNALIDGRNFFDQPVKNDLRTYDNIKQITTSQGDDSTTGCLQDYPYFIKLTNCNKFKQTTYG